MNKQIYVINFDDYDDINHEMYIKISKSEKQLIEWLVDWGAIRNMVFTPIEQVHKIIEFNEEEE